MLNHPSIQTRLNRLRYGMLAALAITLSLSLAAPLSWLPDGPAYVEHVLGHAVLHTLTGALVYALIYYAYRHWLYSKTPHRD